jgi:hypothetical protein
MTSVRDFPTLNLGRPQNILTMSWFPLFQEANTGPVPGIRPRPLPVTSTIYHSVNYQNKQTHAISELTRLRRMPSSGMCRRGVLVRTGVSGKLPPPSSGRKESARYVPPKRRSLHDAHGVTSQKTTFFIVNAVKTSNLT